MFPPEQGRRGGARGVLGLHFFIYLFALFVMLTELKVSFFLYTRRQITDGKSSRRAMLTSEAQGVNFVLL